MTSIYLMSVLVCLIMFASIAVHVGSIPDGNKFIVAALTLFCILCPVLNTLIAGVCIVVGLLLAFYLMFI
jgi:hypothetical protein